MREKRHIARTKNTTFCGRSYIIWRTVLKSFPTSQGWERKRVMVRPFKVTTYNKASCEVCKQAFEAMAQTLKRHHTARQLLSLAGIL